ncbi:hypothetical protein [Pseudomonas corrugata]
MSDEINVREFWVFCVAGGISKNEVSAVSLLAGSAMAGLLSVSVF